jgi:hypothetical protein
LPLALTKVTIVLGVQVKILRSGPSDWCAEEGGVNWMGGVRVYRQTDGEYNGGIEEDTGKKWRMKRVEDRVG